MKQSYRIYFLITIIAFIGCNGVVIKQDKTMPKEKKLFRDTVKFGQVYRAIRKVMTDGVVIYSAPISSGFNCVIPKDTLVIVSHEPPKEAIAIWAIALNYKELEGKIVPVEGLNNPKYDMYGIGFDFQSLRDDFVLEPCQEIKFDDEKIQKHWETIVEVYNQQHDIPFPENLK